ncbi:hypothetical protein DHD32_00365 [Arenibacter sp. TNZ]|jgi:hypothetical protein|uniref:hypothetical protein n=1 Tax=Arenibacter TaxID=178469 RepID=UPI000CD46E7A|nr:MULTISPECIES: hypothetical protein [Arenibacter]MCM4169914.1 hypothetical protein [Arenibacter sp. TNZ]
MENNHFENLFRELKDSFDIVEPNDGHRQRFLAKLETPSGVITKTKKTSIRWKALSIAAALLLFCALGFNFFKPALSVQQQVSNISPEITNTEYYFASLIEEQIKKMQSETSPVTQKLITDTMGQLRTLDTDYKKMEQDLLNGGNSKLILSAMITNFQTRIDLINEVLEQIEEIKILKNYKNENITT